MTAKTEKSGVVFTSAGAIYRPGNGKVIHYRNVGGMFYRVATPDAVVRALEEVRSADVRVRLYYGDRKTGRDWLEEHHVEGYIGCSTGPLKVPLLIYNRRSAGGFALLDHCIVKIKRTTGSDLYQHPKYHTGTFVVRNLGPDNRHRRKRYTHAVDVDGQNHANFRSQKEADEYVHRMTT
jgi:hypothetical protein